MNQPLGIALALALAAAACGGSPPPPAPAPEASAAPTAEPSAAPATVEAPTPPPPDLTPLSKPPSKWTVGGASLSTIESTALLAAFKKAGWVADGTAAGRMTVSKYESVSFDIAKGKAKGNVLLVRPTAKPEAPSSMSLTAPSDLPGHANKDTTAFTSDADADVFLSVEITEGGKAADAKKLLGSIAKQGK
jgi:hypothetical protein